MINSEKTSYHSNDQPNPQGAATELSLDCAPEFP